MTLDRGCDTIVFNPFEECERNMTGLWDAITDFFVGNVDLTFTVVLLCVIALLAGAYALWRKTGDATKPVLMVVLAGIAIMNVLIWTIPMSDGTAPIDKIGEAGQD
ncbi:MAG: hypothetical protein AAFR64_11840 [Pseudomonadota bacterium]